MTRHRFARVGRIIVVFLPILAFIEFSPASPHEVDKSPKAVQRDTIQPSDMSFLMEEYETATSEISRRIDQEHLLFVLKFTVVGAVLGLVFVSGRKKTAALPLLTFGESLVCWAAVSASALIDVRIHFNVRMIRILGDWIRELERFRLESPALGYETWLDQSPLWTAPVFRHVHLADRFLLTWILFVATLYLCVPLQRREETESHYNVAKWMLPVSMVLMGFAGLQFESSQSMPAYYLAGVGVAILISFGWLSTIRIQGGSSPKEASLS